ncbi:hypothetical protein CAC42_6741 [Sphaceloma murrayae]|uniref:Uncharacterized protein n=1 Tax=Sphaceloma murrayae TaxID=2082308 RepID=A0A2K1QGD0_9PEZI|nr:hypothetical protein CAC42_6741 [Sphaceloma murrayae]
MLPLQRLLARSSRAATALTPVRSNPPFPHFQCRHASRIAKTTASTAAPAEQPASPLVKKTRAKSTAATPKTPRAASKKSSEKSTKDDGLSSPTEHESSPVKTTKRTASTTTKPAKREKVEKPVKAEKAPKAPKAVKSTKAVRAGTEDDQTKVKRTRTTKKASMAVGETSPPEAGIKHAAATIAAPCGTDSAASTHRVEETPHISVEGAAQHMSDSSIQTPTTVLPAQPDKVVDDLRSEQAGSLPVASSAAPPCSPDTIASTTVEVTRAAKSHPVTPVDQSQSQATTLSDEASAPNVTPDPLTSGASMNGDVESHSPAVSESSASTQSSIVVMDTASQNVPGASTPVNAPRSTVQKAAPSPSNLLPPGQSGRTRSVAQTRQTIRNDDTGFEFSDRDETPEARYQRGLAASEHVAKGGKLPPRYKGAARRVTAIIVALPFVIVGTPIVWERVVEGKGPKQRPGFEGGTFTLEQIGESEGGAEVKVVRKEDGQR